MFLTLYLGIMEFAASRAYLESSGFLKFPQHVATTVSFLWKITESLYNGLLYNLKSAFLLRKLLGGNGKFEVLFLVFLINQADVYLGELWISHLQVPNEGWELWLFEIKKMLELILV
jgi:hypothetical protein